MRTLCVALALLVLAACGGTPPPGNDSGTPGDSGVGADTGGTGGDAVAVRVREVGGSDAGLAGAVVALDRPGGMRVEATTGADGIARFDVAWANGPYDIVAWATGHSVIAALDVDRAAYERILVDGAYTVGVRPLAAAPTIRVSGAILGATASTHTLSVLTTASQAAWNGRTGPYELEIPAATPFRLIALEILYTAGTGRDFTQEILQASIAPEHPGSSADVAVDVDLTMNQVTPTFVSGTLMVPSDAPGASFFATATPYVTPVFGGDTAFVMGFETRVELAADGRSFDYEVALVSPPGVTDVRTYYYFVSGDRRSVNYEDGPPTAGAHPFEFLAPPEVRELTPGAFPHVFDTVVLTNAVPEAAPIVAFTVMGETRFAVSSPPGEDHVVIPPLPTGADPAVVFAGGLGRQVSYCVPDLADPSAVGCTRYSVGYSTPADP